MSSLSLISTICLLISGTDMKSLMTFRCEEFFVMANELKHVKCTVYSSEIKLHAIGI